jgi:hypothetical protein
MSAPTNPMSKRHPLGPRVKVRVTAEIINASVRSHSGHCMIAESIKLAFPEAKKVAVDVATCRFTDPTRGLRYVYLTPRLAQDALINFDEGLTPEPFDCLLTNAHVSRAGSSPSTKPLTAAQKKAQKKRARYQAAVPTKATLVATQSSSLPRGSKIPRVVGGKRPPQLSLRREFGVRRFRAASIDRLVREQQQALNLPDPE